MSRFNILGPRAFGGNKRYILFVSTGNTCRAPMAYGVMKKLIAEAGIENIDVRTGGVMTVPGLMPTQECRHLLMKEGIDIAGHRSCQLTPDLIKRASLVLGMTSFHVQMALRMTDCARGKTWLLKEFAGFDSKNDQVQDPMGCTLEVYKRVFRDIRGACKRLMKSDLVVSGMAAQQSQKAPDSRVAAAPKKKPARPGPARKSAEPASKATVAAAPARPSKPSKKPAPPPAAKAKPVPVAARAASAPARAAKKESAVVARRAASASKNARKA